MCSEGKPHPESLLKAALKISIDPASCIYIGDHQDDITAAGAAGTGLIVVSWSQSHPQSIAERVCTEWGHVIIEIDKIVAGSGSDV